VAPLAEAMVRMRPDWSSFRRESVSGFHGATSGLDGEADKTGQKHGKTYGAGVAKGATGPLKGMSGMLSGFLGTAAVIGVGRLFTGWIADARESEKVSRLTAAAIKSTGGAANVTEGQVSRLATRISNLTAADDELVQTGSNLLLTFTNVRNEAGKGNDIFNQATASAVDMAAGLNNGVVTQENLKGTSIQLGKALNNPIAGITALTKAGVTFTDQQKKQIRTLVEQGDVLGAQKIILKEVGTEFGGAAAAAADPMDRLKVVVSNLGEEIGARLLPFIETAATWLGDHLPGALAAAGKWLGKLRDWIGIVVSAFNDPDITSEGFVGFLERVGIAARVAFDFFKAEVLPRLKDLVLFIRGSVIPAVADFGAWLVKYQGWLLPIAAGIGAIVVALKIYHGVVLLVAAATKVWAAVQVVMNAVLAANPIGLIVLALVGLVAALIFAWKHSETFRQIVTMAFDAVWRAIKSVWDWLKSNWPLLLAILTGPFGLALLAITRNWDSIKAVAKAAWDWLSQNVFTPIGDAVRNLGEAFRLAKDAIGGVWEQIKTAAKHAWDWLDEHVFEPIKSALDGIKGAWNGIKSAFEVGIRAVPGIGNLFGGGGGKESNQVSTAGRVFPLPPGSYSWGRGPAGHGYDAQDLPVPAGTPVRAPVSGLARGIDLGNQSYGKYVQIASSYGRVILAHMSRLLVGSGFVRAGQVLGYSGTSGNSTGPHLHVEPSRILRFDRGGWLPTGPSLAINNTGRPERILAPGQTTAAPINIYNNISGSVTTERDLVRTIRDGLTRHAKRGDPMP